MAILVTASFGLVAALAWNDAIQKVFLDVFVEVNSTNPMIIYAILVTIVAVFATIWINDLAENVD